MVSPTWYATQYPKRLPGPACTKTRILFLGVLGGFRGGFRGAFRGARFARGSPRARFPHAPKGSSPLDKAHMRDFSKYCVYDWTFFSGGLVICSRYFFAVGRASSESLRSPVTAIRRYHTHLLDLFSPGLDLTRSFLSQRRPRRSFALPAQTSIPAAPCRLLPPAVST